MLLRPAMPADLQQIVDLERLPESRRYVGQWTDEHHLSIEFKRFVVAQTGRGLGRRLLAEILRIVFDEIGAHRFFLDVVEDNARTRHLYRSFGFSEEGILREATQRDGQ